MAAYEIAPRVWFGSAGVTHTEPTRFTHIVNCETSIGSTSSAALKHIGLSNFLFLKSDDDDNFPILATHLPTLTNFITNALIDPAAQVYIHCYMGINRSAALAVGYVCATRGEDPAEIIAHTRKGTRRLILTNKGFVRQLYSMSK